MRILTLLLLATAMAALPAHAAPARRGEPQRVVLPDSGFVVSVGAESRAAAGTAPRPDMVKAMMSWLARNFDLPAAVAPPAIRFESARRITAFRYTGVLSDAPDVAAAIPAGQREVVAAYDPLTATIYLPADWSGATPAELSILAHELVHHLQRARGLRYECVEASEELAYAAQDKWLSLFGRTLAADFEIDAFTILASTRCIY
jgi:hypothetical protein